MSRERERFDEIGKKIKRESDALLHPAGGGGGVGGGGGGGGRRHIHQLGPPGTLNTITPCAACKLLRRRCAQECPFYPYFSPHEPQKFASVHKIFGASNVSKMLMEVPENQRADTANSIVYEANMRLRDPVYGCMGAISALQQQIQVLQAQLNAVRAEILKYYNYKEANVANINSNINVNDATNYHLPTNFLSSGSGFVSIAAPPPGVLPSPSPPPPALPGLTPSLLDPPDSSISSSMNTQPSCTPDNYSSISNENVSYFG